MMVNCLFYNYPIYLVPECDIGESEVRKVQIKLEHQTYWEFFFNIHSSYHLHMCAMILKREMPIQMMVSHIFSDLYVGCLLKMCYNHQHTSPC